MTNATNQNLPANSASSVRWLRWLGLALLLVAVALWIGWRFAASQIQTRIGDQLAALELGMPQIDRVSVSSTGVQANDVRFFRTPDDKTPWLTLDRISIQHPLRELIAGTSDYEQIELAGATINVDPALLASATGDTTAGFNLNDILLPADEVRLTGAKIVFTQPTAANKSDGSDRSNQVVSANAIDLTFNRANDEGDIDVSGTVGQLLGGKWKVGGSVSPTRQTADLNLASSNVTVTNGQWQQLPFIPAGLDRYVTADGQLTITASVDKMANTDWSVIGNGKIKKANINLPTFNFPIRVQTADFQIADGQLEFQNIVADLNDEAEVSGTSRISVNKFPIEISFNTQFKKLTAETLRRLVSPLPEVLSFSANGIASGTVKVERSTRTQIDISAQCTSPRGGYGDIQTEMMSADVSIEQLTFADDQTFESIGGRVDATAQAPFQDVVGIFNTFDLNDLQRQLAITGDGAGRMQLQLPLATANHLNTWQLTVDANAAAAEISGQPLRNVRTRVEMNDGQLVFQPLVATAVDTEGLANGVEPGATAAPIVVSDNLNLTIRWPLVETDDAEDSGSIAIDGQRVPTEWLVGFYQTQMATLDSEATVVTGASSLRPHNAQSSNVDRWLDQLAGDANVTATLAIPTDQPDDWTRWTATADVRDSTVRLRETSVQQLASNLRLERGTLTIDQLTGQLIDPRIDTGTVNTTAAIDLVNQTVAVEQANLKTGKGGKILVTGKWAIAKASGLGAATWEKISLEWLADLANVSASGVSGQTDGQLELRTLEHPAASRGGDAATNQPRMDLSGQVVVKDFLVAPIRAKNLRFNVSTQGNRIQLDQFKTAGRAKPWNVTASLATAAPYPFSMEGTFQQERLSQLLARGSVTDSDATIADVTGILSGQFSAAGQLQSFDGRTNGHVKIEQPTYNGLALSTIEADWDHLGNDWKKSRLRLDVFGGTVKLAEASQTPQRVRLAVDQIDAKQLSSVIEIPFQVTGKLSGDASLNDWSLRDTRWADMDLKASSILLGDTEFGDFHLHADYRLGDLTYEIAGAMLDGKLVGTGKTKLPERNLNKTRFPLELRLTGAVLDRLHRRSKSLRWLRPLTGQLTAIADVEFSIDRPATGSGRISAVETKWDRELVTKNASIGFRLSKNSIVFDDVRADLKRGTIAARAIIPTDGNAPGTYEINVRNLDLERVAEAAGSNFEAHGLLDARFNGQLGKRINGQGTVGVHRATVAGVAGRSLRLPVQFRVDSRSGTGRIELRRSTFRLFNGNASGEASVSFGNGISVNADLKLSNVDTGKMLASVADFDQGDQGKLTGRIRLKGRGIRSTRDLKGSFRGEVDRVSAFKLPIFEDIARVLAGGAIQSRDYDSEEIILLLDNNRVEIRKLNFSSSLVKIAITGYAYLDGRLDMAAATRVDRLQQPSLIDSLAGSPLTRLSGSPVAFFAQAAEFLSERIVFFKIGGTYARPQVRLDTSQQLREETIRYFLRGSQILPDARSPGN